MFEGVSADTLHRKNYTSVDGEGLAFAYPGSRTHVGASGTFVIIFLISFLLCHILCSQKMLRFWNFVWAPMSPNILGFSWDKKIQIPPNPPPPKKKWEIIEGVVVDVQIFALAPN